MESSVEIYPGLGLVQYAAFPKVIQGEGPVLETLEAALTDDVFNTIEITWIKDEVLKRRACEMIADSGKRVVFSGGPPYAFQKIVLSSLDRDEREHSIECAKKLIDDALLFAACIHLITSGPDPGPANREKAKDVLVESILELSNYVEAHAKNSPLLLSMEPVDRAVHRKGLIGPISEAVEMAQRVDELGGKLFLTIDQSHLAQLGERSGEALAIAYDYLFHVHLANCIISDPHNPLYGDEHPPFGIPGGEHGLPELVAFLESLQGLGYFQRKPPYSGWPIVSVEVKPQDDRNPLQLIQITKGVLAEAFSCVEI